MNMVNKYKKRAGIALAMLLVGGLLVLMAGFSERSSSSFASLLNPDSTSPSSITTVGTGAKVENVEAQTTTGITGAYSGEVAIQGVQTGVYSNTLTLPAVPTGTVPADLGTIALSLQLTQTGNSVIGYVLLDRSLTFTKEHTVSIPGQGVIGVGPAVRGSYDGTTLILESAHFTSMVSGQEIVRQFRLIGNEIGANGGSITGEYRETLWGFAMEPFTSMGAANLARPDARRLTLPSTETNTVPVTVNDVANTAPGAAVTVNVLANDVDGEGDALTITNVNTPANGTATHNGQSIVYTPNAGFEGTETLTYIVSDAQGNTAVGTLVVQVGASAPGSTPTPMTPEPGATPTPITPTPDPSAPDDDNDGIPNKDEDINKDGDLTNDDTDGDGTPNYQDDDDDGDGAPTKAEGLGDTNANGIPDYLEKEVTGIGQGEKIYLPFSTR